MVSRHSLFFSCLALAAFAACPLRATITLKVKSSILSPQPLGTPITWTASATDSNPNPVTYRFEVAAAPFTSFSLLADYSTTQSFQWNETYVEGQYEIRVTARDYTSGESTQFVSRPYQITSLVVGGLAAVHSTDHPLVALFSAPSCPIGSTMNVTFLRAGYTDASSTDARACHAGSMNFYIAGMTPDTSYLMNYQVTTNGVITNGPQTLSFTTGAIPKSVQLLTTRVIVPASSSTDLDYKISLSAYDGATPPFASNLQGEVVWYSPMAGQLLRTLGQTYILNGEGNGTGTGPYGIQVRQQVLREIDLEGNVVRMTNADRVSEQLEAMGTDPIARFNHDAIRLANGHTLALSDDQRAFPAGTQGSSVPLDIIGEVIVELDEKFQVVWFWNAFDHDGGGTQLNINRAALQHEVCKVIPEIGITPNGCPPGLLPGFTVAQDWLHGNSTQLLSDGNLILSLRNQDWIVKIHYQDGAVLDGDILWRLGNEGDFSIVSNDSYPWFSGQHQPDFFTDTDLSLFDNGNVRVAEDGGNSRGMAFSVDQTNMVVTTMLSADLGVFASSQGSAQRLPNGNFLFQPGTIDEVYMQSLEVQPNAPNATVFNLQAEDTSYRTFRMPDMYTPPYGTVASTPSPTVAR